MRNGNKNFFCRVRSKIKYLTYRNFIEKRLKQIYDDIYSSQPKVFYFCVPIHSNLGDQAQFFCWERLFSVWYPQFKIISIQSGFVNEKLINAIRSRITADDKIFIHSGYLFSDIHPELPTILNIVKSFKSSPIIILPQTINFKNQSIISEVSHILNSHPKLTIISRDKISFENSQALFPNCELKLMPDVVTSLIGSDVVNFWNVRREGVILCLRNDSEKYYTNEELKVFIRKFQMTTVKVIDTTIKASYKTVETKRKELILQVLKEFSKYQVVITDRYHGTIFSQIVNTPVIVLSTTDHKLSSGVDWFPKDEFGENVFFAGNLDEAYSLAIQVINRNGKLKENSNYFMKHFYSKPL